MNQQDRLGHFELKVSEDDQEVAYLRLPTCPRQEGWKVSKSIRLVELMGPYSGPDVVLDFDPDGVLVGIEIV